MYSHHETRGGWAFGLGSWVDASLRRHTGKKRGYQFQGELGDGAKFPHIRRPRLLTWLATPYQNEHICPGSFGGAMPCWDAHSLAIITYSSVYSTNV